MSVEGRNRVPLDSGTVAEVIFIGILIWMIAGPVSGLVLATQSWLSSLVTKSVYKVESAKDFAAKLMVASQRIKTLEKKVADDELELTKLRRQAKDTDNLRMLLNLHTKLSSKTVAADVITRNPDNWFEQAVIDKGANDNIQVGSAVITNQGVVGQIISTSPTAAVVRLLTDPDQKIGVLIPRIHQSGVLSGRHRSPAAIDFVPVGTAVDVGDKVVCLGNGGVFPSEHPIGTVSAVKRDVNGTTLSIDVKLAESLYDLRQVLVVPPQI